jgi:hypothetical protein
MDVNNDTPVSNSDDDGSIGVYYNNGNDYADDSDDDGNEDDDDGNDDDDDGNDSDNDTQTSTAPTTEKKSYKKRRKVYFKQPRKGVKKGKYTYQAKDAPRQAKVQAAAAIATSSTNIAPSIDDSTKMPPESMRQLISLHYTHMKTPPPQDWYGEGGTISLIVGKLDSEVDRRTVYKVIRETYTCAVNGEVYDPSRKRRENKSSIAKGSEIEKLVADYREAGLSYSQTTLLINIHCTKLNLRTVRRSAVVSCVARMKKTIRTVGKRPQGNPDKNSNWAKARFRWVAQLLIRLGHVVNIEPFIVGDDEVPLCFNSTRLRDDHSLSIFGIGWWDETHKNCELNNYMEGEQTIFPRNEDGE